MIPTDGVGFFPLAFTHDTIQRVMNLLPNSGDSPTPKNRVNRFPLRKFPWQIPPLATCANQIKDRVNDPPTINRLATFLRFRQKFFNDSPLLFCQVCAILDLFHNPNFIVPKDGSKTLAFRRLLQEDLLYWSNGKLP